jgi:hypothetical protein
LDQGGAARDVGCHDGKCLLAQFYQVWGDHRILPALPFVALILDSLAESPTHLWIDRSPIEQWNH